MAKLPAFIQVQKYNVHTRCWNYVVTSAHIDTADEMKAERDDLRKSIKLMEGSSGGWYRMVDLVRDGSGELHPRYTPNQRRGNAIDRVTVTIYDDAIGKPKALPQAEMYELIMGLLKEGSYPEWQNAVKGWASVVLNAVGENELRFSITQFLLYVVQANK